MKIFGDTNPAYFKTYHKEPGLIFGHNDILKADKGTSYRLIFSFFGNSEKSIEVEPKLYLHISTNLWSSFTGKLREYCLPWRWKAVYLDKEDGKQPERILICTKVYESGFSDELTDRLKKLVNQSWFATNLISSSNGYRTIFGKEFIAIREEDSDKCQVAHPLGNWCGTLLAPNTRFCHIFRKRGLLSSIKFLILKLFSPDWQEVTFRVNNLSEKVLIRNEDRTILLQQRNYIN